MAKLSTGQRVAIITLVAIFQVLAADVFCDTSKQVDLPENKDSIIRIIDSTTYGIGNLIIDRITGEIQCPGWVNMDNGVVEYLALAPSGKPHESVLVDDIRPMHLQLALLLIGLEYGQNIRFQGDSVYLSVSWQNDAGETVTHEGSIIATYSAPVAILNNPLPERMDDIYFAANQRILPPRNTIIELNIKKR